MTDNDKPEFFGGNKLPDERKQFWYEGFQTGLAVGITGSILFALALKAVIDMWVG